MSATMAPLSSNTLANATQGLTNNAFFAVRSLVLVDKMSTIVQELNKEHKLFAPLAEFFKKTQIGDACIKAATILCGPYAFSTLVNDFYNSETYYDLIKSASEVVEMGGFFLSYIAENISSFAVYAPTIALIAECAELLEEGFNLYGSGSDFWANYWLNSQSQVEIQLTNTKGKIAGIKVIKSVLKIFSILAAFNAYSILVTASLSAASISLSLGADLYKEYSAEQFYRNNAIDQVNQISIHQIATNIGRARLELDRTLRADAADSRNF